MTPSREADMHLFDDNHAHTAWCWWDCDEARWVCPPVVDALEIADDHGVGDPGTLGDHIAGVVG
jgi:hypothetical protein